MSLYILQRLRKEVQSDSSWSPVSEVLQLAVVGHAVSAARGRLTRNLPLASGWGLASRRATALRAKEAEQLLLAKAAVRLPASTAL